jgi:hypothetical protein
LIALINQRPSPSKEMAKDQKSIFASKFP